MIDVLVARDETIRNRRKDLKNILSAWFRAQEYIESHGDEVFPRMAEAEDMSVDTFRGFYNSFTFYTAEENREIFSSPLFTDKLQEMNDFLFLHEAISEKADVKELFTPVIIEGLK